MSVGMPTINPAFKNLVKADSYIILMRMRGIQPTGEVLRTAIAIARKKPTLLTFELSGFDL